MQGPLSKEHGHIYLFYFYSSQCLSNEFQMINQTLRVSQDTAGAHNLCKTKALALFLFTLIQYTN